MQALRLYFHRKNWPWSRIVQGLLGLLLIVNGLTSPDYALAGVGGLFALMALFNYGCGACRGQQCDI